MKTKITCPPHVAGRILVGPCRLRSGYCRIVSERGGSGRIERFDSTSGTWLEAPATVSFTEVWNAPTLSPVAWGRIVDRMALKREG